MKSCVSKSQMKEAGCRSINAIIFSAVFRMWILQMNAPGRVQAWGSLLSRQLSRHKTVRLALMILPKAATPFGSHFLWQMSLTNESAGGRSEERRVGKECG